jgi:hypothetical protein
VLVQGGVENVLKRECGKSQLLYVLNLPALDMLCIVHPQHKDYLLESFSARSVFQTLNPLP